VRLENETVWLSQIQIAEIFGVDRTVVTKHLKNIFQVKELAEDSTCEIFAHVGNDGKQRYKTKYYNLDVILSVGYRVNSVNATERLCYQSTDEPFGLLRRYAPYNEAFRNYHNNSPEGT
jgi:hypothetical protein